MCLNIVKYQATNFRSEHVILSYIQINEPILEKEKVTFYQPMVQFHS